jgi:hypothetical protein
VSRSDKKKQFEQKSTLQWCGTDRKSCVASSDIKRKIEHHFLSCTDTLLGAWLHIALLTDQGFVFSAGKLTPSFFPGCGHVDVDIFYARNGIRNRKVWAKNCELIILGPSERKSCDKTWYEFEMLAWIPVFSSRRKAFTS